MPVKFTWRQFALPLFLIGGLLFVIVFLLFVATGGDIPFDYGLVLDAGDYATG